MLYVGSKMKIKLFQRFGDLKVIGQVDYRGGLNWWPCQCKCSNYRDVEEKRLLSGKITTCVACEIRRKLEKFAQQKDSAVVE